MNNEYETLVTLNGSLALVSVSYEMDGYKPLIYGIFLMDEFDTDVTVDIEESEFDRVYTLIERHEAEK